MSVNGALYGTTESGGTDCHDNGIGCGTVFSISPSGSEKVLYAFKGGSDGEAPFADLIYFRGALYGTTAFGGGSGCNGNGCGTIFKLAPDGTETVLHAFAGGNDGASPAGLINIDGTMYGTTGSGGGTGCGGTGCGTVFSITP